MYIDHLQGLQTIYVHFMMYLLTDPIGSDHREKVMGLRVANRPITDAEGFAVAVVIRAEFGKGTEMVRKSKDDVDVREYERFELELGVEGTGGVIPMTIFTGTTLNGVLDEIGKGKAKKLVYNRLSAIALGLGIVEPEELEGVIEPEVVERVQKSLIDLEGQRVKFKLGKIEGRALLVPVPDSLRLIE